MRNPVPQNDPLMRLQWLHVRAKPNHCREIRPPAHRPPWDDAGAEAQRRAVTSISHVVLVYYELKFVQVYGRRLGTTGWGERTAYFLRGARAAVASTAL
jgi:hypothetical protein